MESARHALLHFQATFRPPGPVILALSGLGDVELKRRCIAHQPRKNTIVVGVITSEVSVPEPRKARRRANPDYFGVFFVSGAVHLLGQNTHKSCIECTFLGEVPVNPLQRLINRAYRAYATLWSCRAKNGENSVWKVFKSTTKLRRLSLSHVRKMKTTLPAFQNILFC